MPPVQTDLNRFFKRFTVPKERVPDTSAIEEEIIVVPARKQDALAQQRPNHVANTRSPQKKLRLKISRESSTQSGRSSSRKTATRESSILSSPPPTTRTPRASPQKRSAIPQLDGAADDMDLFHSSPTPSTQRQLRAVEIPSPRPRAAPIPTPTATSEAPLSHATTSFSSCSTLSSVPMSSQNSSRRVVKGGLMAVTNSDSGSDSDDELADIDSFMPRKKQKMTPPRIDTARSIEMPDTVKPARHSARLSDKGSVKSGKSTPRLPPSPPRTVYKHSLMDMVKANEKREKQDARIAEAEAAVAAAAEKRKEAAALQLDGKTMAEAMADDSDQGARMVQALARTEAAQCEAPFSFFADAAPCAQNIAFPTSGLPAKSWANLLREDHARDQACLTGFVAQLARLHLIPKDALEWFAYQLAHEPREELCEAYLSIIQASPQNSNPDVDWASLAKLDTYYRTTLSPPVNVPASKEAPLTLQVAKVFSCICGYTGDGGGVIVCSSCGLWQHASCYYPERDGRELAAGSQHSCVQCRPDGISVDDEAARKRQKAMRAGAKPDSSAHTVAKEVRTHAAVRTGQLGFVVRAMAHCARQTNSLQPMAQTFVDLALANMDEHVRSDLALRTTLGTSIETLLANVFQSDTEQQRLCSLVARRLLLDVTTTTTTTTSLRCQIVTALPATAFSSHGLRRRLALALLLTSADAEEPATPTLTKETGEALLHALQNRPDLTITAETDYALLPFLAETLDIAIDAGFSRPAPTPAPPSTTASISTMAPFAPKRAKTSPEEKAFDSQIDRLAMQLRLIASRIKDAGTAHLRRTEAKSALERVVVRVEQAVRTRERVARGVFDAGGRGSVFGGRGGGRFKKRNGGGVLEGFVMRAKQGENVGGEKMGANLEEEHVTADAEMDGSERERDEVDVVGADMLSERHMSDGDEEANTVGGAAPTEVVEAIVHPVALRRSQRSSNGLWNFGGAVRL
ncbi:hypothetical protein LTR08_001903 [Meristemomyces frigidus]|nr:hypothetical protein LTR08_001903 [Meristemomyces frigidus]